MKLGVFAKIFSRDTLEQVLEAVRYYGFSSLQFNMACAGLPSLPAAIPEGLASSIAIAQAKRGLNMAAVSGTYNRQVRE
jgi:sugar phosphate isomerase/epimerase